jgi:hypothetical protein
MAIASPEVEILGFEAAGAEVSNFDGGLRRFRGNVVTHGWRWLSARGLQMFVPSAARTSGIPYLRSRRRSPAHLTPRPPPPQSATALPPPPMLTLLRAPGETVLRAMLAILADKDSGRVAGNWRASLPNSVA